MSDHDALLRAIGEHPEEDTPRLMYADWLEEQGESDRADFVRNQVELARCDSNDLSRYLRVRKNVYYLTTFVPRWKAELPQLEGIEWGDFNRGLIEEVRAASGAPLVRHAAAVFAVPGIHVLRFTRLNEGRGLSRRAELARLRALRLVGARAPAAELYRLLASPHLGSLRVLDLDGNGADDSIASRIADGLFPELAELWLGSNVIGDRGAIALANSPHVSRLRARDLRDNRVDGYAARAALRRRFGAALKL
ncbi:TIGR02996 domain-containing protein [Frigoriglobus tundricola]|uniref:TIGR02996 domain-containing protein n=1 Tax=Frigoriglobus tundricola TaxID=2774151 RepID=A0A6M5YZW0_9BACT|nr:TIGR02996 domain-containing protein [Frigoriglobus tundricola]QJW99599.1 hypothetical protein FTUN_7211 [Frigoriglobus tundricola]